MLVNHIASSAYRLQDTLDAVLEISKLEAEVRSLHPERIDVVQVVTETVQELRPMAEEDGVQLRTVLEPSACPMRLDPSALSTILTNLVNNAVKFTPEGGTVTVDLPEPAGGPLTLRVIDTGVGIDESFREEIFEPFTQESVGADREHEGSGLGLAITRHLVELMNGEIDVRSEKGEGTTFTVRLPGA